MTRTPSLIGDVTRTPSLIKAAARSIPASHTQPVFLGAVEHWLGRFGHVHAQAAVAHGEFYDAVVADDDRFVPAHHADPFLSGVARADVEALGTGQTVREHRRQSGAGVGVVAFPRETDDVGRIEGVMLGAVGECAPHGHEQGKLGDGRQIAGLGRAKEIAPKDAGGSGLSQQDDGVGRRLEPRLDGGGQRLPRLGVVVFDERDGAGGVGVDEGAFEESGEIDVAVGVRSRVQVEVQRHVEQARGRDLSKVLLQLADVVGPVLADGGKGASGGFAKFGQPAGEEVRADVFDGVEPQAVDVGGLDVPASPSVEFGPSRR